MQRQVSAILGLAMGALVVTVTPASAQSVAHKGFPSLYDVLTGESETTNPVDKAEDALSRDDFSTLLAAIPAARNTGSAWEIYATEWSAEDERGYEAFVKAIGRSGCLSIDDCLRSKANPYRAYDDEDLWLGDCTDMVYVLRGYYAFRRGLPFSFEDGVSPRHPSEYGTDLRYTSLGNRVVSRFDVIHDPNRGPRHGPSLLRGLFNTVSTAMLRTDPRDQGRYASSMYPVTINHQGIRPGIAAYDVFGHVSIVYDVTEEGHVLLISSHPDYTVSREPYGANVLRTGPELGSGLKAWRPLKLVGARKTSKGTYIGGKIVLERNEDIPTYSLEQYFGTDPDETGEWSKGRFVFKGRSMPYYDYVQAVLRNPDMPFDPLVEMAKATDALCESIRARRTAVNLAVYAGLNKQPAPEKLPDNIYGTYGDWERYATPSRDARLKTQAVELRQLAEHLITRAEAKDTDQAYVSHDLAAALLDVYDRRSKACGLIYKRTDESRIRLDLDRVMGRIFDLSFDPFHCPERRWGAKGSELATCPSDPAKEKWYDAQRFLRYTSARTYDLKTNFRADQLKDPSKAAPEDGGIGISAPPDVDVRGYLEALAGEHETANTQLATDIIELSGAINATDAD